MENFKELFLAQAFLQCTQQILNANLKGEHEAEYTQCAQNYVNAYRIIGNEFANFFISMPSKDRKGPPVDE